MTPISQQERDEAFIKYYSLVDDISIPYAEMHKVKKDKLFEVAAEALMNAVERKGKKLTEAQARKAIEERIESFHKHLPAGRTDSLDKANPNIQLDAHTIPGDEDSPTWGEVIPSNRPNPEEQMIHTEKLELASRALMKIPEPDRTIFIYRTGILGDDVIPFSTLAMKLNLSESDVRRRLEKWQKLVKAKAGH